MNWITIILASLSIANLIMFIYSIFIINNLLDCLRKYVKTLENLKRKVKNIEDILDINTDNNFRGKK
jgi:hypothetical protein